MDMQREKWFTAFLLLPLVLSLAGCGEQQEFGGVSESRQHGLEAPAAREDMPDIGWEEFTALGHTAFQNSGNAALIEKQIWEASYRRGEAFRFEGENLPGREPERDEGYRSPEDADRELSERIADLPWGMAIEP
ncbi:MAG: hypothetical protein IJG56_03380 [Clostridia bacterium]|nr:hypothetical protein [Clostridia bacterium]